MHKTLIAATLALLASLPAHAQERTPSGAVSVKNDVAKQAEQIFRSSFRADNPKYWMTRLDQDEAQPERLRGGEARAPVLGLDAPVMNAAREQRDRLSPDLEPGAHEPLARLGLVGEVPGAGPVAQVRRVARLAAERWVPSTSKRAMPSSETTQVGRAASVLPCASTRVPGSSGRSTLRIHMGMPAASRWPKATRSQRWPCSSWTRGAGRRADALVRPAAAADRCKVSKGSPDRAASPCCRHEACPCPRSTRRPPPHRR